MEERLNDFQKRLFKSVFISLVSTLFLCSFPAGDGQTVQLFAFCGGKWFKIPPNRKFSLRYTRNCDLGFDRAQHLWMASVFGWIELPINQMNTLRTIIRFIADEDGTTAVEYAVILMLILLAVIGSVQFFGGATRDSFENTAAAMSGAFGN